MNISVREGGHGRVGDERGEVVAIDEVFVDEGREERGRGAEVVLSRTLVDRYGASDSTRTIRRRDGSVAIEQGKSESDRNEGEGAEKGGKKRQNALLLPLLLAELATNDATNMCQLLLASCPLSVRNESVGIGGRRLEEHWRAKVGDPQTCECGIKSARDKDE
jgi:hypothetical protein